MDLEKRGSGYIAEEIVARKVLPGSCGQDYGELIFSSLPLQLKISSPV
jgi:hypothetical protein